jgi:hypothetical protein
LASPVWVGRKLQPTRSNVLNPAEIDAFTPGTAIFPPDPLWKASEIKQHTEALNKLLEQYSDEDKLYEVNFDFLVEILSHLPSRPAGNYPWEDKRVQEALKAMQNEAGMQQGRLNVRRGKETKGKGFKIVNRPAKDGRELGGEHRVLLVLNGCRRQNKTIVMFLRSLSCYSRVKRKTTGMSNHFIFQH